jgi:hypothetical protein
VGTDGASPLPFKAWEIALAPATLASRSLSCDAWLDRYLFPTRSGILGKWGQTYFPSICGDIYVYLNNIYLIYTYFKFNHIYILYLIYNIYNIYIL